MRSYQCVLFDLDHTLWDYETNSAEALSELYDRHQLVARGAEGKEAFLKTFSKINGELWDQYDRGEIGREVLRTERFHRVLCASGVDDYELSLVFSADYLSESPLKKSVMPGAIGILSYLSSKYPLYIITNGFDEIQYTKMTSAGITNFFSAVFTSEKMGYKKPQREIFDHALKSRGHSADTAIMIGDNLLTDIKGAQNAQIDHVYFNPLRLPHQELVTYEIAHLSELQNIL